MTDLTDGESRQVQGSSGIYTIKNVGGVYSCSCIAWRNQHEPIERRTCKHLKAFRGEQEEILRISQAFARAGILVKGVPQSAKIAKPAKQKVWEPMLAKTWDDSIDPSDWWMSEKLDGVRAYWDGKNLWSRQNNKFYAPAWFTAILPPFPLDGELFGGRGKFQTTVSIVRRQDAGDQWKNVTYVIFGSPENVPFEEGIKKIKDWFAPHPSMYASVLPQEKCLNREHLKLKLKETLNVNGEGVMLRKSGSSYESGRSSSLLKVKARMDAEARVVSYEKGKGKYEGMVGALNVETPDGREFQIGTGLSDEDRRNPPAIGSVITYSYVKLSDDGKPTPATFERVRGDVEWKDLTEKKEKKQRSVRRISNVTGKVIAISEIAKPKESGGLRICHRYEYSNPAENSNKFWEISVDGNTATTTYGRIGSIGKSTPKSFQTAEEAKNFAAKKITEKLREGYVKV